MEQEATPPNVLCQQLLYNSVFFWCYREMKVVQTKYQTTLCFWIFIYCYVMCY